MKTCRRGLALCTLLKHRHTLLSDISAVWAVWIAYVVYSCYCIWCSYYDTASPLCDGVNLNDRSKRPHVNVYASVSNSIILYSDSIVCVIIVVCISFAYTYIVSPRFLSFALGNTVVVVAPSSYPPPTYTGRPRNLPLPKRAHGWDMMTPPPT